jgi:hypothetical protein
MGKMLGIAICLLVAWWCLFCAHHEKPPASAVEKLIALFIAIGLIVLVLNI